MANKTSMTFRLGKNHHKRLLAVQKELTKIAGFPIDMPALIAETIRRGLTKLEKALGNKGTCKTCKGENVVNVRARGCPGGWKMVICGACHPVAARRMGGR